MVGEVFCSVNPPDAAGSSQGAHASLEVSGESSGKAPAGVKSRGDGELPLSAATSEPRNTGTPAPLLPLERVAERTAAEERDTRESNNGKVEQTRLSFGPFSALSAQSRLNRTTHVSRHGLGDNPRVWVFVCLCGRRDGKLFIHLFKCRLKSFC